MCNISITYSVDYYCRLYEIVIELIKGPALLLIQLSKSSLHIQLNVLHDGIADILFVS